MCYTEAMKNTKSFFPQQTHFIGVLLPDDITATLEDCRHYMSHTYGCKSGYRTPIHVTLVPPFKLQEEYGTQDLENAIFSAIESGSITRALATDSGKKFIAHIEGFDAFGDRTIFGKVFADSHWTALRDATLAAVLKACPGCTKKDDRPFQPHATVANRDIPSGVSSDALKVLGEIKLNEDFPVDNITIFERKGGAWEIASTIELEGKD